MVSGLIIVFRMTPFSYARSGFAYSFTRNLSDRLRGISEVAVRQPSKLEIENHGLGICLPAPRACSPTGLPACFVLSNSSFCTHCRNCSTLRELLCELQYLHAGTLFARPRPPWARGWRWSAVNTSRFLTSVSASSRRYSCAPQYQHSPPVFAQTYCRLVLGGFNVPSRVRGAPISLQLIINTLQLPHNTLQILHNTLHLPLSTLSRTAPRSFEI